MTAIKTTKYGDLYLSTFMFAVYWFKEVSIVKDMHHTARQVVCLLCTTCYTLNTCIMIPDLITQLISLLSKKRSSIHYKSLLIPCVINCVFLLTFSCPEQGGEHCQYQ